MKRKKNSRARWGWVVALVIVAILALFTGYMALNASFIHLRRATVYLEDLPTAFEGKTILYAADIDLGGINTPRRAAAAFKQLEAVKPDLLLFGGDYTAPTLMDLINQSDILHYSANTANLRADFFHYICDFPTSLGKYMIVSPDDTVAGDMRALAEECGFGLLDGSVAELSLGSDKIYLLGLGADNGNVTRLAGHFKRSDCVIALTYSPSQLPPLMTSEASDSGHWVDLTLSGHTHGGQIRVFGRSILSLDSLEQQFLYGWNRETGVPMLVTSGFGCEGVNLRLNTQPEVWLITLTGQ